MLLVITIIIRFNIEKTQVKLIFIIIINNCYNCYYTFYFFFLFLSLPLLLNRFSDNIDCLKNSDHIILFIFCQLLIAFLYIVNFWQKKNRCWNVNVYTTLKARSQIHVVFSTSILRCCTNATSACRRTSNVDYLWLNLCR